MNKIINNDISLIEETHEYRLSTHPDHTFTSVTTFIEQFFEGFDAPKVANKLINNYPKYAGRTVESLIADWDAAADHGTKVHHEIEQWVKDGIDPVDSKAINGKDWLHGYSLKSDIDILSEVIVYSTELSIAGTVDILAKDNSTGWYEIIDWKTSKKIEMVSYGQKMGTHDITKNIMDCNFYHYSLQLSLYRYILETYYGIKIHNQLIAQLHDDGVNAHVAPYMKEEIIAMLASQKELL